MNYFYTVLGTLIAYSLIAVIVYYISKENDDVLAFFGMGIIGWILLFIFDFIIKPIGNFIRHYNKRSIFQKENTDEKYICNLKDTDDINYWVGGYKLIRRYAPKSEWQGLPYFDKEFIANSKINCSHCKYDDECERYEPKCTHDYFWKVLEFDEFERK